jgi:AraC-like DNA-binding protein
MTHYPSYLSYGKMEGPFGVEYVQRTGNFTMTVNHTHAYYELYYLLGGERSYFIKDRSYPIRKGDLVFINKYEVHKTLDRGAPHHERIVVYFNDEFARQYFADAAELLLMPFTARYPVIRLDPQRQLEAERLAYKLMTEIRDRQAGYSAAVRQTVIELLLLACRFLKEGPVDRPVQESPLQEKMTEIARDINTNYAEPITLSMLAERYFISPYYLSRMFKDVTGFSLTVYINLTRIKEAQQLLRETDMKIIDIAEAVGFDNFSHFGKTFKAISGATPRSYRNRFLIGHTE